MKLLFKQRFFSWFDSYDIYYENGQTAFIVKGELAWGHKLQVYTSDGSHIATLRQVPFSFPIRFDIKVRDGVIGSVRKEFTLFRSKYRVDFLGWQVEGDFLGFDYTVYNARGGYVAQISKQFFKFTDTYVIDIANPADDINVLMVVLAIDAVNCSSD